LKVVRDGSFLAVITEKEYQSVQAMDALARGALWDEAKMLPNPTQLYDWVRRANSEDHVIFDSRSESVAGARTIEAVYCPPYQIHGSIGPSCAVALSENGTLTVWSHTQGVYPLRMSIAEMLRVPEDRVHCIHMEGSGCYGHNGADDVAADAALIAAAFPGRPVRVQWMREQFALHTPRRCRQPDAGLASRDSVRAAKAGANSTAHRGRRPQRDPALQIRQCARSASLPPRNAASRVGPSRPWRI
jgi:nicotinate dehydrogenase subunit B